MKKLLPWLVGILVGVLLTVATAFLLLKVNYFKLDVPIDNLVKSDPTYDMVAISWGGPVRNETSKVFQIQVVTSDKDKDGIFEVSAVACRQGVFFYRIGQLGVAKDMEEAIKEFGEIKWHEDTVTVGGTSGVKGTFERKCIERYR